MKTKFIKSVFVTAIAMVSGINVFNAQKTEVMSDIVLDNVEALAADEDDSVNCNKDKGDVCIVGSTTVSDYDEGCSSWFWG